MDNNLYTANLLKSLSDSLQYPSFQNNNASLNQTDETSFNPDLLSADPEIGPADLFSAPNFGKDSSTSIFDMISEAQTQLSNKDRLDNLNWRWNTYKEKHLTVHPSQLHQIPSSDNHHPEILPLDDDLISSDFLNLTSTDDIPTSFSQHSDFYPASMLSSSAGSIGSKKRRAPFSPLFGPTSAGTLNSNDFGLLSPDNNNDIMDYNFDATASNRPIPNLMDVTTPASLIGSPAYNENSSDSNPSSLSSNSNNTSALGGQTGNNHTSFDNQGYLNNNFQRRNSNVGSFNSSSFEFSLDPLAFEGLTGFIDPFDPKSTSETTQNSNLNRTKSNLVHTSSSLNRQRQSISSSASGGHHQNHHHHHQNNNKRNSFSTISVSKNSLSSTSVAGPREIHGFHIGSFGGPRVKPGSSINNNSNPGSKPKFQLGADDDSFSPTSSVSNYQTGSPNNNNNIMSPPNPELQRSQSQTVSSSSAAIRRFKQARTSSLSSVSGLKDLRHASTPGQLFSAGSPKPMRPSSGSTAAAATVTASASVPEKRQSALSSSLNNANNVEVPIECTNCKTKTTPLWRRDPEGLPLCNACGLFLKLHGETRPLSLKTDVIKKRNRGGSNTILNKGSYSNSLHKLSMDSSSSSSSGSLSSMAVSSATASAAIPIMKQHPLAPRPDSASSSGSFKHVPIAPKRPFPPIAPAPPATIKSMSFREYKGVKPGSANIKSTKIPGSPPVPLKNTNSSVSNSDKWEWLKMGI